jgi:uncharacterized protein (TIGR02265 family)
MESLREAQRQFEARLALAGPGDTCRGIFFNGVLDAVRRLAGQETEALCRQVTGERKFTDFFSYPVSGFIRLGIAALPLVGPQLGGGEAMMRWMGVQSANAFMNSAAGRTAFMLVANNLKKLFNQLPISYRAATSYGERQMVWTGEKSGRFIFKRDFLPPAYHEGVLLEVMLKVNAKNPQVRGRVTGPLDTEFDLSWS